MLLNFFYFLRRNGLKISPNEWVDLLTALARGFGSQSQVGFYQLVKALCVKSEKHWDRFDQLFLAFFDGKTWNSPALDEELSEWLIGLPPKALPKKKLPFAPTQDLEELRKKFQERMQEQKGRHDGGNKWIGTHGTSPFGHSGYHPDGLRVEGQSRSKSASQVIAKRKFADLSSDKIIDTRQMSLALKKLRRLERHGHRQTIDMDATVNATARNLGDVDIVMQSEKTNSVRLCLLMDVGGSMDPYVELSENLFSAAAKLNHFKEFRSYFFHNCPYEHLRQSHPNEKAVLTQELIRSLNQDWYLVFVGDASMHPWELSRPGGSVDYFHYNEKPGLWWIQALAKKAGHCVWLNPLPRSQWHARSISMIGEVVPDMFPLSLQGLQEAIDGLMQKSR